MRLYSLLTLLALAAPLSAQDVNGGRGAQPLLPFTVGVQFGMGWPSGDVRCKAGAYVLPALEIRNRGRFFLTATAERLQAMGPIDDCLIGPSSAQLPDGRFLVKGNNDFDFESRSSGGGSHVALGAGIRMPADRAGFGLRARAGLARGQREFESEWLRTLTANLDLWLGRRFVLSFDRRWFRIPQWQAYISAAEWNGPPALRPAITATEYSWQVFHCFTFAWHF